MDLNDEYNSLNPSGAVDGYEYPKLDNGTAPRDQFFPAISTKPVRVNPAAFQQDLLLAVELLASHVRNLYRRLDIHDPEVDMEIEAVVRRMRSHG